MMKRIVVATMLAVSSGIMAQTPNLGLTLPAQHATNWGPIINNDLTIIDTYAGTAGTVRTLTVGNLSPIFNSSVVNPGTSPALTFSLSTAPAHSFLGNNTGSGAVPSYLQPAFTDISGLLQAAQEPAHTGDVTNSAGSLVLTLATVNSSPGLCGDATHVCQITTNGKGLVTNQSAIVISAGGSGTVTSVAMTLPSWLTVAGSPITGSGTLAVTATTGLTANSFLATPNGSTGPLSIRTIVPADLPVGTSAALGVVQCDSSTITCTSGVISTVTHGTITGSGTSGFIPLFNLSTTAIGNSHMDDGITTASVITSTEPISAPGFNSIGTGSSISTNTASNTDLTGELIFSAATTGTYTFAGSYLSHPECWVQAQATTATSGAPWITYTGVASFTINFPSAFTGNATYGCFGRN